MRPFHYSSLFDSWNCSVLNFLFVVQSSHKNFASLFDNSTETATRPSPPLSQELYHSRRKHIKRLLLKKIMMMMMKNVKH
jgi:hypothetical protein